MKTNKRKNIFFAGLAAFALLAAGGAGVALHNQFQETPMLVRADLDEVSSLVFSAACGGSGTADDGVTWAVSSDAAESNFDDTRGIHYGTGSKAVKYLQLSTSGITDQVTQVKVNASVAKDGSGTLTVTVGGVAFTCDDEESVEVTKDATEYTFTGTGSGEIVVKIDRDSAATKAIFVKSVIVTHTSTKELSSIAVTTPPTKTKYFVGENFDPAGMVVTATFDDESTDDVTSKCTIAPEVIAAETEKVTVSYTRGDVTKTAEIAITVLTIVDVTGVENAPTTVYVGGTINPSEVTLNVLYSNDETGQVKADSVAVDTSAVGEVQATATFNGATGTKTASWTVQVLEAPKAYTLEFGSNSGSNEIGTEAKLREYYPSLSDALEFSYVYKLFGDTGKALRFGSSSYGGALDIELKDSSKYITSFTISAKRYDNDELVMVVNGKEQELTESYADYEYEPTTLSEKIEIEGGKEKRFYIQSIELAFADLTADLAAEAFLKKTGDVCANYDGVTNNGASLKAIWGSLKGIYNRLPDEEKALFTSAQPSETGTSVQKVAARYIYLINKYGTSVLEDFIGVFDQVSTGHYAGASAMSKDNNTAILVVTLALAGSLATGLTIYAIKRKKQK